MLNNISSFQKIRLLWSFNMSVIPQRSWTWTQLTVACF